MAFLSQKQPRVILSRELEVCELFSCINDKKVDANYLKVTSFLNTEEDFLQVDFQDNLDLDDTKGYFIIMGVTYYNSENKPIFISFKHSRKSYGISKNVKMRINLKKILLNLFNVDCNKFIVKLGYMLNDDFIHAEYLMKIPTITERKEWIPDLIQMKNMEVDEDLKSLYFNDFELTDDSSMEECRLKSNFKSFIESPWKKNHDLIEIFRSQLMIEDLKQNEDYKNYQLNNQKIHDYKEASLDLKEKMVDHLLEHSCLKKAIRYLKDTHFILIEKKMPFDLENIDGIFLTEMESLDSSTIKIDYVVNNEIIIFHLNNNPKDHLYNVQFIPNRSLTRMAYQALTKCDLLNVNDYLVSFDSPFSKPNVIRDSGFINGRLNYKNKSIANNIEQKTALKRIINGSAFPSPFLLHGPPGSGKTTTIIEAIVQLVSLKSNTHILMIASNNTACNDISERLIQYVSCNKILRIYSSKYERQQNTDKIIRLKCRTVEICADCKSRYCKDLQKFRDNPCYEEFYSARVVIVTLAGSGSLVNAGIRSDHFDYIFIDDAASIAEVHTLIPIVGLATSASSDTFMISANIILSGDPSQLEPTVTHPFNLKLGMDCSMMERMMKKVNKYKCDSSADALHNPHITQLNICFRSHRAIVRFSYMNFYAGSQLRSSVEENFASGWKHLKNRDFPIMFMDSQYSDDCQVFGKFLLKKVEVNVINYYVNSLLTEGINGETVLPEDIGIISMDLAEPNTIINQLRLCYPNVDIGSVESFQGREKKIIFLSTIRTDSQKIGHKRSDKRLLVALTRAKSLLVVIGNTDKLLNCDMWSKFIMYCINNNAYVEAPLERHIEGSEDDIISSDDEEESDKNDNN
ncbi:unnamed protein product [Diamesa hyperborea]